MTVPSILLVGIGGVYNYGCEAIIRGTENILHSAWPEIDILYASRRPEDDRTRLKDSRVRVIDRHLNRLAPAEVTRKLLRRMGISWQPTWGSRDLLSDVDAVLSIGGDIYTLTPQGDYPSGLIKFSKLAREAEVPYILWGASVGPFTARPAVEKMMVDSLTRASLISAREKGTIDYLQSLGIEKNVTPCADPAFTVSCETALPGPGQTDQLRIAINLSPLSLQFSGISANEVTRRQVQGIENLIRELGANILLVPHVISPFYPPDDDLTYLIGIRDRISSDLQSRVEVLDGDLGFMGTKRRLAECDLVIAARMHCAISALSARVPTLLLAYSQKAFGMGQYVYGDRDLVIDIKDLTPELMLEKTRSLLNQRTGLLDHLQTRIPEIIQEAYHPLTALRRILPE
jgi:colanic acid/amylovoran biosynthesis protein